MSRYTEFSRNATTIKTKRRLLFCFVRNFTESCSVLQNIMLPRACPCGISPFPAKHPFVSLCTSMQHEDSTCSCRQTTVSLCLVKSFAPASTYWTAHYFQYTLFPSVCFLYIVKIFLASLVAQMVKNLPAMQKTQVRSLGQEDPWRRKWQPIPVFLPREFHGWAIGYSPWGCKESDMTECLTHTQDILTSV